MISAERKTKYFSVIISLIPLLSSYRSPVPGVDMGTLCIIAFAVLTIRLVWNITDFMWLYAYVFFMTPVMFLISSDATGISITVILRYLKFIVILGCVFGLGYFKRYYKEDIWFEAMWKCVIVNVIFVIMQQACYALGMILNNPLISLATNEAYIDGYDMGVRAGLFRPSGFFLEPSHLALYMAVFMVYVLFSKNDLKKSLTACAAILATGSGMGLVLTVVIYCLYIVTVYRKHIIKAGAILVIGILTFLNLKDTAYFVGVVNRIVTENISGGGNAIQARIGRGYQFFFDKSWFERLLGTGYGNVPTGVYLNGLTYVINTLGIVGIVILTIVFIQYMRKGSRWQQIGILMITGVLFLAQIFTPAYLAFFFCIYYNRSRSKTNKHKDGMG